MALQANKWEVKSRTWATGGDDYDGCWELTNGEITIATKDDDDIVEEGLKEAAEALNKTNAKFYQMEGKREIDLLIENNDLYGKIGELQAENEALKQQVATLHEKNKRGAEVHRKLFLAHMSLKQQHEQLKDKNQQLVDALEIIQNWQLPSTGQFWDKEQTQPMSFEAAYGSNGARDFMRNVANEALSEYNQSKEGKEGKV